MSMPQGDIQAIVSLLNDADPEIASTMRNKLLQMGETRVADLLESIADGDPAHREVSRVLHALRTPSVENRLQMLVSGPSTSVDLEEGVFTLARFGYPDLDPAPYRAGLDGLAADLAPNVAPDDHPVRVVRALNQCLFEEHGYHAQQNYDRFPDPDNSYINRVIDRKVGLPIALAVVYLLISRRLELPIVGVGMPLHFILKYTADQDFYIDPFNAGRILTANECYALLGKPADTTLLPVADPRDILLRTARNLFRTYTVMGETDQAESLKRIIDILSG